MRGKLSLILITGIGLLLFCYQNFDLPKENPIKEKKFESMSTDPLQRLGDYMEFQMSDDMKENLHSFEGTFQVDTTFSTSDLSTTDDKTAQPNLNPTFSAKKKVYRYGLISPNTFRLQSDVDQVKCRFESSGVNVQWEHKFSSASSYVIEHNTGEKTSQAKFQWSW